MNAVKSLWRRLSRTQKFILVVVSFANTAAVISVVLPSVIIGQIVTTLTKNPAASIANSIILLSCLLAIFVILKVAVHIALHQVLPRVEADLREAQIERTLKTPISSNNEQYAAELNSLMGKGAKAGADTVKIVFMDLMPAVLQVIVAIVITFANQWQIGLILLISGVVSTFITNKQLASQGGVRVGLNRAKAKLDGIMTELLRGKAVIRTLNATDAESSRVGQRAFELSATEVRHHKMMGLFDAAKNASENFFAIIVLVVAAGFVASGANAGTVLTLYLLFMQFATPLRDIHRIRDELNEATLQLAEVFRILCEPLDKIFVRKGFNLDSRKITPPAKMLELKNVSVAYNKDDREKLVVKNVDLTVREGEYLGICGPAGCGKSTLVKAIVGILPFAKGEIFIDGTNQNELNVANLADEISYVSQEPYVISGTIRDNLCLGQNAKVTDEKLRESLEKVGLNREISGLNQTVGEDGSGLSGGQKQRLVLARILLRPAKIIVLDEATSALDNLNEELFMKAIMSSRKTVVAIAHRLSTLRNANEIIVMKNGEICEKGTYENLDKKNGLFHELLHAGGK